MATEFLTQASQPSERDLTRLGKQIDRLIRPATPRRSRRIVGHRGPDLTGLAGDQAFRVEARSRLYQKSKEVAPDARVDELSELRRRMQVRTGDKVLEIGAGDGFVTVPVAAEAAHVYAVDSSPDQLRALKQNAEGLPVTTIEGSFGDAHTLARLGKDVGRIDIATTLATFHHLVGVDEQERVFRTIGLALKPGGSFHGGDPGLGTDVQRFFDEVVETHCITGHNKRWLSPERIKENLLPDSGLVFASADVTENKKMKFSSKRQMVLFMKSLLALDMKNKELEAALGDILGIQTGTNGQTELNWNLLYWKAEKPQT